MELPSIDLGTAYRDARLRLTELVAATPDAKSVPVAACPGWSVHDVACHLAAIAEDARAGRLSGIPSDEDTAEQVSRRASAPTGEVLAVWSEHGPWLESTLSVQPIWPALIDVLTHEQDVRAAVDQPGQRTSTDLQVCAKLLVRTLCAATPVTVVVDGHTYGGDGADGGPTPPRLDTTAWEAFRFRMGRRSRRQMAAMAWTGDPTSVIDGLVVFGPNPHDVIE